MARMGQRFQEKFACMPPWPASDVEKRKVYFNFDCGSGARFNISLIFKQSSSNSSCVVMV